MSETHSVGRAGNAPLPNVGRAERLRAAEWLGLAAAPTFAIMALLTVVLCGVQPDILCSAAHHASPPNGMTAMYLLMSAFHLPAWLKLISGRQNGSRLS